MSPTLKAHFADYATFHATPGNQACHYVAVPLIVLTVVALLAQVELFTVGGFTVTLAEVVIVIVTAYYLTLDATLALLERADIHGSEIRIGVRRRDGVFAAHAWIRWNNEILGDLPAHVATFTEVDDIRVLGRS